MATAVQLNTRIDATLKQSGDAVFARYGINPSEAVRALWFYAAQNQALPSFMQEKRQQKDHAKDSLVLAQDSCGLALKLAHKDTELDMTALAKAGSVDWSRERDAMYEDMLDELEDQWQG